MSDELRVLWSLDLIYGNVLGTLAIHFRIFAIESSPADLNCSMLHRSIILALSCCLFGLSSINAQSQSSKAPPLTPEQSIATMQIQPGYRVTPVLTEPQIHEPTAIAWDGNGRMYVVEMRTYMQDIDGTGEMRRGSRVSRHEDTDGDGVYDKHTVFADNLLVPRMVLPLLDRVIIGETNTLDLKSYQDTNDDGVADKIEMWHEIGPRSGNMEHQPSGLIWNIDNWIYTTYSQHRLRFSNGRVIQESLPYNAGQWGLTQDNVGRMFLSTAGGENPAHNFQQPLVYGNLQLPGEQADGFREVFPIDNVPDVQGGLKRVRQDGSLNWFTGCCGQSIYRGNRLPADVDGDLFICEPVGRLILRAKVTSDDGRIVVSNAYDKKEFIAATDPNFRPVNSATGPDGCLYIVDMYRGIIQEGAWVRDGSYLREVVQKYELDKNIGRGRIFRIDHESTVRGPQPRMLDETPVQLVAHLSNPNGWWRDEAQKLIVLHGDKSVVPELQQLARSGSEPLGRLHAFWTLEGLDAADSELLLQGFGDSDARVRAAAVRIAEPRIESDPILSQGIAELVRDESPDVAIQTLLTAIRGRHPQADKVTSEIVASNSSNQWIVSIQKQVRAGLAAIEAEERKHAELAARNKVLADSVVQGKAIFSTLCVTCHGADGKGQPSSHDPKMLLAPPLAGSPRVQGHKQRLVRILLHGLIGPVDDTTYADGLMLPMGANDDVWIANVGNYIRNSWDNEASIIEPADVANVRADSQSHVGPWTLETLQFYDPAELGNRSEWKITASGNGDRTFAMIDGDAGTRWDTGKFQTAGQWVSIELPEPMKVMSIKLDARKSKNDYPRGYEVHTSVDGVDWGEPVALGYGDKPVSMIEVDSPDAARHIRITQTGASGNKYWSIHELGIHAIPAGAKPPASFSEVLAEIATKDLAAEAVATGDADRGAALFYSQSLSCSKCHDPALAAGSTPGAPSRLGPDLTKRRDEVTAEFLVDSVLNPSKVIHQEFQQVAILTFDGVVLTGFPVRETDDEYVIREPAGGKEITVLQDDIEMVKNASVSAMPPGLVNQLTDRKSFADLVKFLIEVSEGGPRRMSELKSGIGQHE
ncbi:MAG: discoidin domain-containing protein [Rubripirellula sp.]